MKKLTWEEVRDELITDYCNDRCKKYMSDYYCPDHSCVAWLTLNFCNDGLNNYPTKKHRVIKSPPKPRPIMERMSKYKGTKNKVQLFNPRSKSWTLVDTKIGGILSYRKKPYKNIPIKGKTPQELELYGIAK